MVVKDSFIKTLKAIGIIALILVIVFIIDTAVVAFKYDADIVYDEYINQSFVSQDMKTTIKFISNNKIAMTENKRVRHYSIKENEHNILLIQLDEDKQFIIKFLDENTIYCEKTKEYLYLATKKE